MNLNKIHRKKYDLKTSLIQGDLDENDPDLFTSISWGMFVFVPQSSKVVEIVTKWIDEINHKTTIIIKENNSSISNNNSNNNNNNNNNNDEF
mgnify:CR=1 FL=1